MIVNGHQKSQDLDTLIIEGELLDEPIHDSGQALDMAYFEREIGRVLNKMRITGRRDEDTEKAMLRAIETYEAATR